MLTIGTRDVHPLEQARLKASSIRVATQPQDTVAEVDRITKVAGTTEVYLHFDLDLLDASEGRAGFAVAGGLGAPRPSSLIDAIASRATIRAALIMHTIRRGHGDRIGRIAIEAAAHITGATSTREYFGWLRHRSRQPSDPSPLVPHARQSRAE